MQTTRGRGRRHGGHDAGLHAVRCAHASCRTHGRRAADWRDALDFRRIVEPRRGCPGGASVGPRRRRTTSRLQSAHDSVAGARGPRDAAAGATCGSTSTDRQRSPAHSRVIESVTRRPGDPARDAAARSRSSTRTSPTPTPAAREDRRGRSSARAARRSGAPGDGGPLRRHRRAAAWTARMSDEQHDGDQPPIDRYLTLDELRDADRRRARSTRSSSPSPTCRAGCRASGSTAVLPRHRARARHRGLQLPARRRRRHEHRRRLRDQLVGARLRRHGVRARPATRSGCCTRLPGTAMVQCDLAWLDETTRPCCSRRARSCKTQVDRAAGDGHGGVRRHRAGVHRLQRHLRGRVGPRLPAT